MKGILTQLLERVAGDSRTLHLLVHNELDYAIDEAKQRLDIPTHSFPLEDDFPIEQDACAILWADQIVRHNPTRALHFASKLLASVAYIQGVDDDTVRGFRHEPYRILIRKLKPGDVEWPPTARAYCSQCGRQISRADAIKYRSYCEQCAIDPSDPIQDDETIHCVRCGDPISTDELENHDGYCYDCDNDRIPVL